MENRPPSPPGSSQRGSIRSFALAGPAGKLEAVLNLGRADAPFAALVCHPHPLYGGNLHNKVVYHAMKALNDPVWGLGWPVLRFNFRSVDCSQGQYDGQAEVEDVFAALDWLEHEFDRPLILAGFSFGAAMALNACCGSNPSQHRLHALIALGLPLQTEGRTYSYPSLHDLTLPKLFISGDRDSFAPAEQLTHLISSAAEPKRQLLLHGVDHFFSDHLHPMQRAIASWLKELPS
jgi:hypothetical protein